MAEATPGSGEGNAPDLSALLGSLGQGEGGPDLSALLGMLKGGGQGEDGASGPGSGGVDFASLLGMLGGIAGGGEEKAPPGPGPGTPAGAGGPEGLPFDPALLTTLNRAMKALREPDRNIQLLQALRPFLEPERQRKVDEAVKILHLMRLAPLLQESGILSDLLG